MAILSNGKFYGFLCSAKETGWKLANGAKEFVEDFVSGFSGHGWKIWQYVSGKWMLEIDALRVRGTMTVFELLISKIRAIIGAQAITQGCGRIKTVNLSEDGTAYLITLEDGDMSFVEHDFIRCQEFTGSQKSYHVEIESVENGIIKIPLSEFEHDEEGNVLSAPSSGDDIVQFGNSSHDKEYVGRHSAIYMHADESAQPAIDVLDGIYSKDWSNCLKVRMGGDLPGSGGLKGLYCVNGMIKGVDTNSHTTYCIYPDGSAEFGDGSAMFKPDKSGHIAGGAIKWVWNEEKQKCVCTMKGVVLTWENLDDEAKENLKGEAGKDGAPGTDGINGTDGVNGKDGISLVYKGELPSHPSNPQNGWYYRNTTDKKSYVFQDGAWYVMTVDGSNGTNGLDGINGKNGNDGVSIVWKGDLSIPPVNPQKNWAYRDTDNGRVYIYNGTAWELMVADGNDGTNGTNGTDGMSVYITYHDSEAEPLPPSGDGTTNGWHTNATSSVVWMSQKVAENASSGIWGNPIKVKGERGMQGLQGIQGERGEQGIQGPVGADGIASYFHIRYSSVANPTSSGQMTETPDKYIGTYIDSNQIDSNDPKDYTWYRFQGLQGETGLQGIPGPNGENGRTSYLHIKYSDDSGETFTAENGETPGIWIGVLVDFELNDSTTPGDYKWSKIKGEDGKLPDWLEEWNGYATTIGDGYIVTPKLFSGTKTTDADGKTLLTGIVQGKDCLTDADGNTRTGIFALVDNEIVFEMDPVNKKYVFKGKIESSEALITGGQIGNLNIKGDSISSEGDVQTKLLIGQVEDGYTGVAIYGGTRKRYPGDPKKHESKRIWIRTDYSTEENITGISLDNYADGNTCMNILSNGGVAIRSHGTHIFKQRRTETWDAPGVLLAGYFNCEEWYPRLERSWGNGCLISYAEKIRNGIYTFNHNLGHNDYYVLVMTSSQAREDYKYWGMICTTLWFNNKQFQIQFRTTDGSEKDPLRFQLIVFGRNKTIDNGVE